MKIRKLGLPIRSRTRDESRVKCRPACKGLPQPIKAGAESRYYLRSRGHSHATFAEVLWPGLRAEATT